MYIFIKLFVFSTLLFCFSGYAKPLSEVISKIKPSVVGVGIYTPLSRPQNILRGTGFAIGSGQYVVTNNHVLPLILDDALNQKMAVFVGSGNNAEVRNAEIIARSETHDLAILKISGNKLPAMTLATDEYVLEGNDIAFTGFPIGAILGLYPVTHRGIISALTPVVIPVDDASQISIKMLKRLRDPYMVYQLDAVAYPGNSGSALYRAESGEVIGIINKVFVQETKESVISNPSGITYAIPVKYLLEILKEHNIKI